MLLETFPGFTHFNDQRNERLNRREKYILSLNWNGKYVCSPITNPICTWSYVHLLSTYLFKIYFFLEQFSSYVNDE